MGINWKKAAGQVAGGSVGGATGNPLAAVAGWQAGGAIGEGGMKGLEQKFGSWGKGNISGRTNGGDAPPRPPQDWWKVDQPKTRNEITNSDGTLQDVYKMQKQQINAPSSRIGELDRRMDGVKGVNFANVGNTAAGVALAGLSARSLSNDLSSQAQARMGLIDQQRRSGVDAMNQNVAGATAGAMGNLAASGGMDSGARQRLQSDAIKARMSGVSGLYNQAAQNKSQVGIEDLTNQYDLQTRMPGMFMDYGRNQMAADQFNSNLGMEKVGMYRDQARGEDDRSLIAARDNASNAMRVDQFNIQNQIADKAATDAFNMDKWKTGNAAQAGQFTADAQNYYAKQQANRGLLGNNGGLLGTGLFA